MSELDEVQIITRVKKEKVRLSDWLGSRGMGEDEDPVPGIPAIVIAIGIMVAVFAVVIAVLTR